VRAERSSAGYMRAVFLAAAMTIAAGSLYAAPIDELSTVVGKDHDRQWQRAFAVQLETLSGNSRFSTESLRITLQAMAGTPMADSPREAARFAFDLAVRVDRSLRRGTSPAEVALFARREAQLSPHTGSLYGTRENVRTRMRELLSGMGATISDDVENRAGPQSGPGTGPGQGGIRTTGSGTTSGTPIR